MIANNDLFNGSLVLIVDDSGTTRTLVSALLEPLCLVCHEARSATECRDQINRRDYDIVVLDYELPDGDGLEVLRELRAMGHQAAIVMLTGKSGVYTPTEAISAGADGFLEKRYLAQDPVTFQGILARAVLSRRRLADRAELEALRAELYGLVAHDLRGPAACAEMAVAVYRETGTEDALETAQRAIRKLLDRLDRYIDVNRLEDGFLSLNQETVDLSTLLKELHSYFEPLTTVKNQRVVLGIESDACKVMGDAEWLRQALENLIENAYKYTQPGGTIKLTLSLPSDHQVRVSVSDDGPGVPNESLPHLFKRYYRVPSQSQSAPRGLGLGLRIAGRITEAHGGRISVLSPGELGRGTTFIITLPRQLD